MMRKAFVTFLIVAFAGCQGEPANTREESGSPADAGGPIADSAVDSKLDAESISESILDAALPEVDAGVDAAGFDASNQHGLCDSHEDRIALEQIFTLGMLEEIAEICQASCFAEEKPPVRCEAECISALSRGALSAGCASCFVASTQCNRQNDCRSVCFASAADCQLCKCGELGGTNCWQELTACTGVSDSSCVP